MKPDAPAPPDDMKLTQDFPVIDKGVIRVFPDVLPDDWGLVLDDGREIFLRNLAQHRTYAGLLCGMPCEPEYDVRRAISQARDWDRDFHPRPAIIPAPILRGIKPAPTEQHPKFPIGPRPWAHLPVITSFGIFGSTPRPGANGSFASALVIWWQGHFGVPADPGVLASLRALRWDAHVEEWDP